MPVSTAAAVHSRRNNDAARRLLRYTRATLSAHVIERGRIGWIVIAVSSAISCPFGRCQFMLIFSVSLCRNSPNIGSKFPRNSKKHPRQLTIGRRNRDGHKCHPRRQRTCAAVNNDPVISSGNVSNPCLPSARHTRYVDRTSTFPQHFLPLDFFPRKCRSTYRTRSPHIVKPNLVSPSFVTIYHHRFCFLCLSTPSPISRLPDARPGGGRVTVPPST